ncbi:MULTISPECIES: hypothetical protein [unclassified Janthinobacterium]|uniref:hypothetical protein n=1 Tax=unclassified Janthinobacterium TaxID=2610881 RepID=UPI00036468F0|nr:MULTISPECIES: hypothetical protein [unclassified Janthinobacterium]MEC5161109.1 hypothetical protein [Janthinobacterium sp. CG_S6]
MRLPGTRYQEHGWEQVRKLLGQCSLQAFKQADAGPVPLLDWYTDAVAAGLRRGARGARADAAGNSYGESVFELALSLVYELQAQPGYWDGFVAALARDAGGAVGGDAMLRKKVNDMYAGLRDKVDSDGYQVALGRACSPNKMYTYRMLDTAYHEIAALFAGWRQHAAQVAAILGRAQDGVPIETRQMKSIAGCQADWIIRWSETLERFGAAPGPLHTKSKRFASLKNNPATIAAMLAEIGDYEELSSNRDSAEDWHGDAGEAALWLEDYWRVMAEPEPAGGVDQILAAAADEFEDGPREEGEDAAPPPAAAALPAQAARDEAAADGVSLPPRYIEQASAAQDGGSWTLQLLKGESLPIRLAVYQKLLGSADDSYPDAWRDPATGELPTLQQLAGLDRISMPTLRKRRNEAISRLQAASAAAATGLANGAMTPRRTM